MKEPEWPTSELGLDERERLSNCAVGWCGGAARQLGAQRVRLEQRPSEAPNGLIARTQDGDAPLTAGAKPAGRECREHAGAHQTGFATARWPDHRQKSLSLQNPKQTIGMRLAPEKNFCFVRFKGAQARIGGDYLRVLKEHALRFQVSAVR